MYWEVTVFIYSKRTCCRKATQSIGVGQIINHCCPIHAGQRPVRVLPTKVLCNFPPQCDLEPPKSCMILPCCTCYLSGKRSRTYACRISAKCRNEMLQCLVRVIKASGSCCFVIPAVAGCIHQSENLCTRQASHFLATNNFCILPRVCVLH